MEWKHKPNILGFSTRMVASGQLHAPVTLSSGRESLAPRPHNWYGGCGEKIILLLLLGIEPQFLRHPACGPSLQRLHYPGSRRHNVAKKKYNKIILPSPLQVYDPLTVLVSQIQLLLLQSW
jgi:hypothetical protein